MVARLRRVWLEAHPTMSAASVSLVRSGSHDYTHCKEFWETEYFGQSVLLKEILMLISNYHRIICPEKARVCAPCCTV
jgi:hypothetical protein